MITPDIKRLTAIIIDDEIDACKNLQRTLLEYIDPTLEILAIVHNTIDAEQKLVECQPDIVFLDIEMPHENAFEFLARIATINFELIFVTAYDDYAIKAFKLNAIDYILKPISIEEVSNAVEKARERVEFKKIVGDKRDSGVAYSSLGSRAKLDKIRLKDNSGTDIVDFKDILYVEAKGSYTGVCFLQNGESEKNTITSHSLNDYEEMLPAEYFYRIHRSYLVNCRHISKVSTDENLFVIMKNKAKLPVSRRRITELMEFFKKR